jgi:membrane protein
MLDALRILQIMSEGMDSGVVVTLPDLSRKLHVGFFTLEEIMERLVTANLVRKAEGQGWLMIRDASHIRATELLHLFVLDRSSLLAEQGDEPMKQWLANCAAQLEKNTDVSLQELFSVV